MTEVTPVEARQEKSFAGDFRVADDIPPLVRPGRYKVMLDDYRTALMFTKAHKLILDFSIVSFGEYFGVRLPRYYNVLRFHGKAGQHGNFSASKKGDLLREMYTLFYHHPKRKDRIPMSLFNGAVIEADVTVVTEARGKKIPKALQYSKIARLVKVVE